MPSETNFSRHCVRQLNTQTVPQESNLPESFSNDLPVMVVQLECCEPLYCVSGTGGLLKNILLELSLAHKTCQKMRVETLPVSTLKVPSSIPGSAKT